MLRLVLFRATRPHPADKTRVGRGVRPNLPPGIFPGARRTTPLEPRSAGRAHHDPVGGSAAAGRKFGGSPGLGAGV